MVRIYRKVFFILLSLLLYINAAAVAAQPEIQNVRFSQSPAKVRIVLEMSSLPEYKASLVADKAGGAGQLLVEMPGAVNKNQVKELNFTDQTVSMFRLDDSVPGKISAAISLKTAADYKVFTLTGPNRLVIDVLKQVDQKSEREIVPGLKYTEWLRYTPRGPVFSYILDAAVSTGLKIKPILSNDEVPGLERLSSMAAHNSALAAVNGSYFALNGETIGTLKLDGEVAGIPELARTAFGIMPDGNIIISQVNYHGTVILPGGQTVEVGGVDSERGQDSLVLYNHFYGDRTGTNEYGMEYVINNNKVVAINSGNSAIPAAGTVLSAHGTAKDALAKLKVGDTVIIKQTLGDELDKASDVLGAGPMLVKNSNIFVTAKAEEFPADIAVGRAPRTALGITGDGHVLLVVVDGRQPDHSIGMTLTELAGFMKELGAVQAMNLDGGGSSEMTVEGKVANIPSDGRERPVGTAIAVQQK